MPNNIEFVLSEIIIMTSTRLRTIANHFVFRKSKITGAQFRILRLLAKKNNQNSTDILRLIGGTKSNLSQRIKSLEKSGFVSRSTNKNGGDRRNIQLTVTQKGRELVAKLMRKFEKATSALENQFSKKEIEMQSKFFKKMNVLLDNNQNKIKELFEELI